MATIKVPYTYKSYPYSKKATFISKHTHKPNSCFLISTILLIIPGALGVIIYNTTGQEIESVGGAIASVILLLTIWTMNAFTFIYVLTEGGPAHMTEILSLYIYRTYFKSYNLGKASAAATVLFAFTAVISLIYNKFVIGREAEK